MKKLTILLVLLVLLIGCKQVKNEDILAKTSEVMENLDSFRLSMDGDMNMNVSGMTINMLITMDMEVIKDPMLLKAEMKLAMPIMMMEESLLIYGEVNNEGMFIYSYTQDGWTQNGPEKIENPNAMPDYVKMYKNSKRTNGKYNGVDVYKFSTTINGEDLRELMAGLSPGEAMDVMELFAVLDDFNIPVVLYVDQKNYYALGMEVDMGEMMQEAMKSQGLELNSSDFIFKAQYQDFNQIPIFEIPKEAKIPRESNDDIIEVVV